MGFVHLLPFTGKSGWLKVIAISCVLHLCLIIPCCGVEVCPRNCKCVDSPATALACDSWDFRQPLSYQVDQVSQLLLRHTVGPVPDGFFANFTSLEVLEIVSGTRLHLDEHTFQGLHSVSRLVVTGTDLRQLQPHALAFLPRLASLDVSNNRLSRLHPHQFSYNTHLTQLKLSGNPLHNRIANSSFSGIQRLHELDLSNCSLSKIQGLWFRDKPTLGYLNLSNNQISSLQFHDTMFWNSLRSVDLSSNAISVLAPGAFNATVNVETVNLSNNYITNLTATGLSATTLLLDNNSFTIANRSFIELPSDLRELSLSYNKHLRHVGRNLLAFSPHLERVNITYNWKLTEIDHSAFENQSNLKTVNIGHNALKKMPRSLAFLRTDELFVADNNYSCSCSLQWYRHRPELDHHLTCWMGETRVSLEEGMSHILCEPVTVTVHQTYAWVQYNSTVTLACRPKGRPLPGLTWVTPQRYVFHWYPPGSDTVGTQHHPDRHTQQLLPSHSELDHYILLEDGSLRLRAAAARHHGRYVCLAENDLSTATESVYLTVGQDSLHHIKMTALLMALTGCLTAIAFAFTVRLGLYIFYKCGCCICCTNELPPRAKRIKGVLDSVEQWRAQQLLMLRENYNQQVANIKDSCYQQVERIRETYKGQARYLGDMRDYGAQQIEGFREQYLDQVRRVRDYSLGQMNRVHENYIFQRNRIRKFSAHQLVRLRETYKYQQKTLNKIMENLPDLYLQNCRTGTCQRTDSIMFPDEGQYCQADVEWSPELIAQQPDLCDSEEEDGAGLAAGPSGVDTELALLPVRLLSVSPPAQEEGCTPMATPPDSPGRQLAAADPGQVRLELQETDGESSAHGTPPSSPLRGATAC